MGQISAIHFQKSNNFQTEHNDRNKSPNYLIGGYQICDRNHKEALALKKQIIESAKEKYQKLVRQRFQGKNYEWSAVCNIKPDTTMQDLEKLAKHFSDKYGFQCYQIAIHRDEGHIDDNGNKVINHHAHLEFITLDKETGKTNFKRRDFSRERMREIQTETAQILQMKRGKGGQKRIAPRRYAEIKEQERKARREAIEHSNKTHHAISFIFDTLDEALGLNTAHTGYDERLKIIVEKITTFTK